ncbi:MAG: hypothetical protein J7K54_01620 [Candidatus Aenigmarchaeota archaeon]|nr:hypothetical protein [Candidatus Aenigmarchaeota archaeon]
MRYYGILILVLVCLIASVAVQGQDLFASTLFTVGYGAMSVVLLIGSKREESFAVDMTLGMLLIFATGFMSTQTLIELLTNNSTEPVIFKLTIIASLDFAALSFFRSAAEMRHIKTITGDGRYAIG